MSILAAGWWAGGVLNLPVALVWPQTRPSCDEYNQEGNQTGKEGRVVTTSPWERFQSKPNMVCAPRSPVPHAGPNGSEVLHLSLEPTGLQRPPRTIMIIIKHVWHICQQCRTHSCLPRGEFHEGISNYTRQAPIPKRSFFQSTNNIIRIKIHGLPRAGGVYVILCCI